MRRPLLSVLLFLTFSLAVAFAVASDTSVRERASCTSSGGGCSASCARSTAATRPALVHAGERHGNPAVVPHAFIY